MGCSVGREETRGTHLGKHHGVWEGTKPSEEQQGWGDEGKRGGNPASGGGGNSLRFNQVGRRGRVSSGGVLYLRD